jgi:heme exporter protein B
MTAIASYARTMWWLARKDLRREFRTRMTWPAMLLLGLLLVMTVELQTDLPADVKEQLAGGLLWLAVFFSGTIGLERSFADENDEGCWDALRMYPLSPTVIYTAKLLFNFTALMVVTAVLLPLFAALSDVPLLDRQGTMLLVSLLANLGLAAIGTLIGALVNGMGRRGNLIALVLLPLVLPVLLGAGEATRLVIADDLGQEFWRWLQLLAAFSLIFVTAAVLIFEFVMED